MIAGIPNHRIFVSLTLLLLVLTTFLPLAAQEAEQEQTPPERTTEQKLSLIEIYSWSNKLPKDLIDLRNDIDTLADLDYIQQALPDISEQIEDLQWQATTHTANPNLTYHEIALFESDLARLSARLRNYNAKISTNLDRLDGWFKQWLEKEKEVAKTIAHAEQNFELQDSLPDFFTLQEIIVSGKTLIEDHLRPTLLAGHEVGKIQTKLYELNDIAFDLVREMKETGTQQTSPSLLSGDFYNLLDRGQLILGWVNVRLFLSYQWGYLWENLGLVALTLAIILLLSYLMRLSGTLVSKNSGWYLFASKPLVAAVFIFCTVIGILNTLAIDLGYPPDWDILIYLPMLIAVAILIGHVGIAEWQVTLCRHLLLYFAIMVLLSIAGIPRVLFYLFVFYASLLLLGYYLVRYIQRWTHRKQHKLTWAVLLWAVFPAVIIIAGAAGYDQLAVALFSRILSIIAATISIRLILLFVSSLLEMILTNVPWNIVRENAATIVQQITPLLFLLFFVLWVAIVLTITWVYPTLDKAFAAIASAEFQVATVTITPGSVLTLILIVYLTILISRALQAFLLQEVLPRYRVEKGVQLSITRLVHYAIMTIGFFILLWALGFSMSQITILGGAVGVGIGFGLQAIVNNFVSGLILLFERPVKVGDIIDVDNQIGEVKELGLRATTVQTFDNAEIVIPNSQLITGSVTNWTLAEKKVRVRVPVGVAYGTDIEKVLKILLTVANENPAVLSSPKPVALFLAFGSSSLDFELRAWIPDVNDKLSILSELNQEVEAEFDAAGIEIPFPQTDLHLRTVDRQAAQTLADPEN